MAKSTISMGHFQVRKLLNYQRVSSKFHGGKLPWGFLKLTILPIFWDIWDDNHQHEVIW